MISDSTFQKNTDNPKRINEENRNEGWRAEKENAGQLSARKSPAQRTTLVSDLLASLDDEPLKHDYLTLVEMMQRIRGHEPKICNVGTIGFDTYQDGHMLRIVK